MSSICAGISSNITAGIPKVKTDEGENLRIFEEAHKAVSKREKLDIKQKSESQLKAKTVAPLGSKKGKSKLTSIHLAGLLLNNYAWNHLKKGLETTRVL